MAANQVQIPVIQHSDQSITVIQQNINKVLRNIFNQTSDNESSATDIKSSIAPVGSVMVYAGSSDPDNWIICDGRQIPRSTYSALYSAIGTNFGQGDGSTTFNIPDLRGGFARGTVGLSDKTFVTTAVDTSADTITVNNNGFNRTGFPIRFSSTGTLPSGLSASTNYYVIYINSNTLKVASSYSNAISGTAIDITSTGSGTHTVTQWADPDASSRTASSPGGNSGDSVGSFQDFASQKVTAVVNLFTQNINTVSGAVSKSSLANQRPSTTAATNIAQTMTFDNSLTNPTSDNETRPRNFGLNYIIKY